MGTDREDLKRQAGERAADYVESGMAVGLGAGSTARWAMRRIAALVNEGTLRAIQCVACSLKVEDEARRLGIPLISLDEHPLLDLTIDGADEATPSLDLIKGGGGALLREKIVAQASRREIIVVDESKLSPTLGTRSVLPIEVTPFGWKSQGSFLQSLGATVSVRRGSDGGLFVSDQGNMILDCTFGAIERPERLALSLNGRAGILEHGLFLGLASEMVVAGNDGLRILRR